MIDLGRNVKDNSKVDTNLLTGQLSKNNNSAFLLNRYSIGK